ncbi:MAG: hypothetical protein K8L91_33170 [Anaerolineae bacterium]|nr:hypothetical protein [Anaerolineae bacterium]
MKNKILIIVLVALLCLFSYLARPQKLSLPLPQYNPLSNVNTHLICGREATGIVYGENNPQNIGIFARIYPHENSQFNLNIQNDQAIFEGKLSAIKGDITNWNLLLNTNEVLIAYLYIPYDSDALRTEYFSLFIDKQTGQGILSASYTDVYINKETTGYATYISCKDVQEK